MMRDQKIEQWCVENRRGVELLSADRRPDYGENARSNHRANAESGERHRAQGLLQSSLRLLRVRDQLVDRLATEKLVVGGARTARGCAIVRGRNWSQKALSPEPKYSQHLASEHCRWPSAASYLFAAPRTIFLTFRFFAARASSRGFSGLSVFTFLRDVRFAFLRSSLLSVFVFAMSVL